MISDNKQYQGIQALRFVAALMVVTTHSTLYVSERLIKGFPVWNAGGAGVDIFFVISGFVMMISSGTLIDRADSWKKFAFRRLLRIVPLYWAALTIKLVIMLISPSHILHATLSPFGIVSSYLFIPSVNADGEIKPFLGVGWTLNFEMFFYSLFAIALALRLDPLKMCSSVFLVFCALALFRMPSWSAAAFYFDTIVIEFSFGMLLARAMVCGSTMRPWQSLMLVALGIAGLMQSLVDTSQLLRPLVIGIPALLIVAGIAHMPESLSCRIPTTLITLGESSYALYLFHPMIAPAAPAALANLGLAIAPLSIGLSIFGSVVMTWMIHRYAERPTTEFLKRWLASKARPGVELKPSVSPD